MAGKISMEFRRSAYGPSPRFAAEDAYRALWKLNEGQIDRKKLAEELGIGEGSVRTLLSFLVGKKLVEIRKRGAKLTSKGIEFCSELSEKIVSTAGIPRTDLTFQQSGYAIKLRDCSGLVKSGLQERDAALKAGASGATILAFKEGKLFFPDSGYRLSDAQLSWFEQKVGKFSEGDVLVLSFGSAAREMERGAWSAALTLLK